MYYFKKKNIYFGLPEPAVCLMSFLYKCRDFSLLCLRTDKRQTCVSDTAPNQHGTRQKPKSQFIKTAEKRKTGREEWINLEWRMADTGGRQASNQAHFLTSCLAQTNEDIIICVTLNGLHPCLCSRHWNSNWAPRSSSSLCSFYLLCLHRFIGWKQWSLYSEDRNYEDIHILWHKIHVFRKAHFSEEIPFVLYEHKFLSSKTVNSNLSTQFSPNSEHEPFMYIYGQFWYENPHKCVYVYKDRHMATGSNWPFRIFT